MLARISSIYVLLLVCYVTELVGLQANNITHIGDIYILYWNATFTTKANKL